MKLSIGIVGLPNVGKSTLFKILTKNEVNIANYPFCTIDPNIGIVSVPDERLEKLAVISKSAKIIPAVVEFYDIAGLVRGAYKGEGLGNQFLSHIKETQAIVVVLRVFPSDEIIHVEKTVDPIRDMDIINTELALKDLEIIDRAIKRLENDAKGGDGSASSPQVRMAAKALEGAKRIKTALETGDLPTGDSYSLIRANKRITELNLLTAKKQIYLLNGNESDALEELKKKVKRLGADYVVADLSAINDVPELVKKAYEILDLISFFTTGEDETRAWTVKRGTKAPQAAGVIHSDFEKNFIRAEVVNWQKLLEAGSWTNAKTKGWLRLEGKDYVVQEGDVVEIRHG